MIKKKTQDTLIFSVLISVYEKENPHFLKQALWSIEHQTTQPGEIVLVKDGPLTPRLEEIITLFKENSKLCYKIVTLETNVGLGEALNEGLKHCQYAWVARMDTDDIALPERFEKQLLYLKVHPKIDVFGGNICEFDEDASDCTKEKKVPSTHEDIVKFAKYRNPMNHMTVVFRKSAVLDVGGYIPMHGFEDYYLWMRMFREGKQFANLSKVLVKARAGQGMILRRQGWEYGKYELEFEKAAYQIGFWTVTDLMKNFFIRFLPRLLPVFMVEKLYTLLRKF